jgi:hypothetical protein
MSGEVLPRISLWVCWDMGFIVLVGFIGFVALIVSDGVQLKMPDTRYRMPDGFGKEYLSI